MKTFSDLLDIDPRIDISLTVGARIDNGIPHCRVRINHDILHDGILDQGGSWRCQCDLLQPIDIEISMWGKQYDQYRETAVIIEHLTIDGFDIVPRWTQLATYHNDHDCQKPTAYLGFNGTWRLTVDQPFYQWRHAVTEQGWLLTPTP
jgi:hypothetical protein